jgi:hypothetical protein
MNRRLKLAFEGLLASMLLVGVLPVLCGYPSGAFCDGTAGIGISDYEVNVNVTQGKSIGACEVARVSNEGTLGLTITATWKPDYASGIELAFSPQVIHLNSSEAMLVKAQVVKAEQTGTYSGTIEFTTKVDSQGTGNPSSPAGSAHATFHVLSASPKDLTVGTGLFIAGIIGVMLVVLGVALIYRRKHHKK